MESPIYYAKDVVRYTEDKAKHLSARDIEHFASECYYGGALTRKSVREFMEMVFDSNRVIFTNAAMKILVRRIYAVLYERFEDVREIEKQRLEKLKYAEIERLHRQRIAEVQRELSLYFPDDTDTDFDFD